MYATIGPSLLVKNKVITNRNTTNSIALASGATPWGALGGRAVAEAVAQ